MREFAKALNIGSVRVKNQDQVDVIHYNDYDLMIVCDGMGGANAGEVASEMCVKSIKEDFMEDGPKATDFSHLSEWLKASLNKANRAVLQAASDHPSYTGMGTTAVIALCSKELICIANVGDSRAYLYQDGKLLQVSEDHSLVNQWIQEGKISEEEARRHPQRSVLTNVLGVMEDMRIDTFELDIQSEMILLCSDGVSGMLEDAQIEALIKEGGSVKQISKRLEKAALELGGYDNIAIALMRGGQS